LNFRKTGIKVVVVTIILMFLSKNIAIDPYVRTALAVFGIGSGFLLFFLAGYNHLD